MDFLNMLGLLGGFAFLGAGIKYIDSVFDEHVFNKWAAYALTGICGILMGVMVAADPLAAAVLISIVLGVAITQKIDNFAFIVGALLVIVIPLLMVQDIMLQLPLFPIAVLVLGGIIDELGNNAVDAKRIPIKLMELFFHYRLTMEAFMGILTLAGFFPMIYWLALMFFDLSYHLVGGYAERIKLSQLEITRGEDESEIWVKMRRVHASPQPVKSQD